METLKETSKAKYLGIIMDRSLSWNSHIDALTKRANQSIASLHRNLSSCPTDIMDKRYKSIVCPQLKYALMVWNPETKKLHRQIGVGQVLLQSLPLNQQCHFNAARAWLGGPSNDARPEQSHYDG